MNRFLIGLGLPYLALGLVTLLSWKKAKLKPKIFFTYLLIILAAFPSYLKAQEFGSVFFLGAIILQFVILINEKNSDELFIPIPYQKYLYGILQGIFALYILVPLAAKISVTLDNLLPYVEMILNSIYYSVYLVIAFQGFFMGNMVNHLKNSPLVTNLTVTVLCLITLIFLTDQFTLSIPAAALAVFLTGWLSLRLKNIFPSVIIISVLYSLWVLFI